MGTLDKEEQTALSESFKQAYDSLSQQKFISPDKKQDFQDLLQGLQSDLSEGTDSQEINRILTLLPVLIGTAKAGIEAEKFGKEQEKLATTDALTNAFTKRYFEDTGATTLARLNRGDIGSAAIIYVDIDQFKDFNTNYGHKGGDEALQFVTEVLQKSVRDTDVLARLGGDEFAIICVHKDADHDFSTIRDNVHETFDGCYFQIDEENVPISVSAGLANLTTNDSLEAAQQRADLDMFDQKSIRHRKLRSRQSEMDIE